MINTQFFNYNFDWLQGTLKRNHQKEKNNVYGFVHKKYTLLFNTETKCHKAVTDFSYYVHCHILVIFWREDCLQSKLKHCSWMKNDFVEMLIK